uniref:Plasminogen receptor (KT) n=1 Tax=Timema shepardi TaxID=629360 RepID=A0A7R9FZD2_TIMSH|nr:unnamed protein product [Timema shepardi]
MIEVSGPPHIGRRAGAAEGQARKRKICNTRVLMGYRTLDRVQLPDSLKICGDLQKPIPVLHLPSARTVFNVRCLSETSYCAMPALCLCCACPASNVRQASELLLNYLTGKVERQIQMQNQMRERMVSMQVARARELLYWFGSFYILAALGMIAGFRRTRKPGVLAPLLPLSFIGGYQADMAYGNKLHRIRGEAENIMQFEMDLLELPCGLPSASSIDQARLDNDEKKKLHPACKLLMNQSTPEYQLGRKSQKLTASEMEESTPHSKSPAHLETSVLLGWSCRASGLSDDCCHYERCNLQPHKKNVIRHPVNVADQTKLSHRDIVQCSSLPPRTPVPTFSTVAHQKYTAADGLSMKRSSFYRTEINESPVARNHSHG